MRRYLISFICLLAIGVLLVILLRPWSGGPARNWPDVAGEEITRLEFSGGQNYALVFQEGRWHVFEGATQSLADQRKVEYLLEQLGRVQPLNELPEAASGAGAAGEGVPHTPGITEAGAFNNTAEPSSGSFGPEISKPEVPTPKPDEIFSEVSVLPTSLTLRGRNTWTIAPLVFVDEAGLVSTRLIKNGESQIVYLDPMFTRLLSRPPRYYADLNLFSARPERVVRIELYSSGSGVWELAKQNEGTFTFLQPERFKGIEVAQAGMEFYLHAILSTQSPGPLFITPPEDLEQPFLVVKTVQTIPSLGTGNEREEETLTVGRRSGSGDYVGFSSYQEGYFTISAEKVEQLGRSLLSLRSRPVLPNGIGSVQKARLVVWNSQGEEQVREFTRSDNGWSELDDTIKLIGVDTVFWRLGTLQTEGRGDDSLPGDIAPILRWQFEYAYGKEPLSLTFFASPTVTEYHWVQLNASGPYFPVHYGTVNEILGLLPAPPSALPDSGAPAKNGQ